MKKGIILIAALFLFGFNAEAQRFCYVDVQNILDSIPEYQKAQLELDQYAARWRQEIAQKYQAIDELYKQYQAEQVLLSENAQAQREEEIVNKEKEAREFQKLKFGPEGELFQKRQELVKPIQDKVYAAIEEYAKSRGFDFIFDKSSSPIMLYTNPELDKTGDIIRRLPKK